MREKEKLHCLSLAIFKFFVIAFAILNMLMLVGCVNHNSKIQNNENRNSEIQNNENQNNGIQNNQSLKENNLSNTLSSEAKPLAVKYIDGTRKIENIEISNIKIELIEEGRCRLSANVENLTDKDLPPTNVDIRAFDANGEVTAIFGGIITELIWHEKNEFVTYVWKDITNIADIQFRIIE